MTRQRRLGAVLCALAALCVAFPATAAGADLRIGFIDSERIFAEYAGTREAQESFNREVQDLSKTAKEKKTDIDDLQRKLDAQGPMLSEAKRDEQNQQLQKKIAEYDAFVQTNWGPSGTVSKLRISDGQTLGVFAVGSQPSGLAFDGANIWVANAGSNTVSKL